jgi:hypothetical protein
MERVSYLIESNCVRKRHLHDGHLNILRKKELIRFRAIICSMHHQKDLLEHSRFICG